VQVVVPPSLDLTDISPGDSAIGRDPAAAVIT
jgi:hypothetical protein